MLSPARVRPRRTPRKAHGLPRDPEPPALSAGRGVGVEVCTGAPTTGQGATLGSVAPAPSTARATAPGVYRRHRPETTALYEGVRDNLETLYGAIDDGAIAVRIPKQARKELEAYLGCGLLCRGFARLRCGFCGENRIVAFSCKGRGFCPSCLGRRMGATAANLRERVLPPESSLRQ